MSDIRTRTYLLYMGKSLKKFNSVNTPFSPFSFVNITPGAQFSHYSIGIAHKGHIVMTHRFSG
jgi:hypothetical protein